MDDQVALLSGVLACSQCRVALRHTADEGWNCETHGRVRTHGGIPSFVEGYDGSFEDHWERNASTEMAPDKLQLATEFLKPVLSDFKSEAPRVLDAGCGEGAHAAALCHAYSKTLPLRGVALDIAMSGLRAARSRADDRWAFIHGDMDSLPFVNDGFDAVYSFGVLALTPDPRRALAELVRVTRPGGLIGLWVFPGLNPVVRAGLTSLRSVCRALGPSGATIIANMLVPLYGLLPTRSGLSLSRASWRQTREVMMSNLTPPYLHFLSDSEISRWFSELGVERIPLPENNPVTAWGRKR